MKWDNSPGHEPGSIVSLYTALDEWGLDLDDVLDAMIVWYDGKEGKAFSELSGVFAAERKAILEECCFQWFQAAGWGSYVPILDGRRVLKYGLLQKVPFQLSASWFEAKKNKDPFKELWANVVWADA